jgi:hypothetical protein
MYPATNKLGTMLQNDNNWELLIKMMHTILVKCLSKIPFLILQSFAEEREQLNLSQSKHILLGFTPLCRCQPVITAMMKTSHKPTGQKQHNVHK